MNAALTMVFPALLLASSALVACGGGQPATNAGGDGGASATAADASASSDAPAAVDAGPAPRPFASSPIEATQIIGAAIDARAVPVKKCVAEYRARKKMPHQRVEISVGIDQEGRMIGASLKGKQQDAPFTECIQQALEGAAFPRSRAGVISVTKSYEEIEQ